MRCDIQIYAEEIIQTGLVFDIRLAIMYVNLTTQGVKMAKFNPQAVAKFLSETEFAAFDWQVRGLVSAKFGCTEKTAIRWVHRVLDEGLAVRKGNVITLA